MVAFIDHVLCGGVDHPVSQQTAGAATTSSSWLKCRENIYIVSVKKDEGALLAEMMKTFFNITLNWYEKEDDLSQVNIYMITIICILLMYFMLYRRTCIFSNVSLIY